jgi:hypothetical protein
MTDPLADLLLDAKEVDRARLAQGLAGVLGIDKETGRIVLKPAFNDFDAARKVVGYLLGALAAFLLGKRDSEAVAPTEIQQQTGMPKGTVNPKLSQLAQLRVVSKTSSGSYYVATHQIDHALGVVRGSE